jgi:hypothetical protein
MHLNQMHHQRIEQSSGWLGGPQGRMVTILVVGLAGLIHLSLIREHFAAVLLLTVALPEPAMTHKPRGAPVWWGLSGAMVFALLWLILTGVVQWTGAVYPPALTWVGMDSWSALTPILIGSLLPHVWLAAPWWSLPAAFVLAVLVSLNLGYSTSLLINGYENSRGRRARLLALLPAGLAVPVCCTASTPLLALLGVPLFLEVMAAPFAALGIAYSLVEERHV